MWRRTPQSTDSVNWRNVAELLVLRKINFSLFRLQYHHIPCLKIDDFLLFLAEHASKARIDIEHMAPLRDTVDLLVY